MSPAIRSLAFLLTGVRGAIAASSSSSNSSIPSYPMPLPCIGESCTQWTAASQDMNIIQHQNGTYFRVSKDNGTNTGLVVASAPSLAGPWILGPQIFASPFQLTNFNMSDRFNTSLWAPEVHYINGLYYLWYSMFDRQKNPGFSIRVATSPTMDVWTDHGSIGIPNPTYSDEYALIDGSILSNYDSNPYGVDPALQIVWGSFNAALYGMSLNPSNILIVSPSTPTPYIQDTVTPVSTDTNVAGNNRTEGSFRSNMNGWIYFFFSRGQCCSPSNVQYAYTTQVCRARTANGPYYDKNGNACAGYANGSVNNAGTIILQSHSPNANGDYQVYSPGSVGIVNTTLGPVITYQYQNQSIPKAHTVPLSFSFGYNYLAFDSDSWPYLSSTPQLLTAANGTLPGTVGAASRTVLSDPFFWLLMLTYGLVWLK